MGQKDNKNSDLNFNGINDDEIRLIFEMIDNGTFSGKGVEIVTSLKQKVLLEIERRKIPI